MIVLIDLGNSRIKLGWFDPVSGARESHPIALNHDEAKTQIGPWLTRLPSPPKQAVGVSVGDPAVTLQIEDTLRVHGCTVHWQRATACALGLKNGYAQPEQLGADRWAAMLGLLAQPCGLPGQTNPRAPVMLASFGTATTLDTVGPDRIFIGGLILPGPALMLESLVRNTAHLPLARAAIASYPTDTHQAIITGVAAAQAGAVLRQWLIGVRQYELPPTLYVTGGGWPLVAAEVHRLLDEAAYLHGLPHCILHERDRPVLDGLAALVTRHGERHFA